MGLNHGRSGGDLAAGVALAAPFVGGLFLAAWAFWNIVEPGATTPTQNPFVIAISITVGFLSFTAILGMSIVGFYEGWRTGWACGKGRRLGEVLKEWTIFGFLLRLLRRTPIKHLLPFDAPSRNP
jgi:hypothetical protein